ncbi:iron-sulfur cluster insertion protein ErpA [Buchnera aphidicola]|uniref:iron-sulfur cluster insertion protein ErpA n=1 Tax=Buchnera aphidicola TaxID=9 RepID=UPI0031B81F72
MINFSKLQIQFTKNAKKKITQLIKNDMNENLYFRIYITGGGCNGFQYKFKLEKKIKKNDFFMQQKFKIVIDAISLNYIQGGTIDYQETLTGTKFVVLNPNAKSTCSCGTSFSI